MSSWSEDGGVDVPLSEVFKDTDEAEGERTWVGRGEGEVGFEGGAGGPRVLPLPKTLPPPIVRRDIALRPDFHIAYSQKARNS